MIRCTLFLLLISQATAAFAGKYNPTLDIGDLGPAWKELPGTDGKKHSLAGLKEQRAVVVVFTCNSCPYAVDCEDRLIALTKKYASKRVSVVAINVNYIEADLPKAMKERAEEKGFNFPYLYDATQKIAKAYGAATTPECFVLNSKRKVVYMGALDDSPNGSNVRVRHVENAIDAVLSDETPNLAETVPIGCRVRFKPRR